MVDLGKVKKASKENAKFMTDEITKVIKTCGKRDPGSEGEKKAVEYMAEQLKDCCDDVKVESFDVHPGAFMGWIYLSMSFGLIGVVCYFFEPIVTAILIVLAIALMMGEFLMYRQVIDKLFRKKTSYNLTAVKKPSGEVKRRLFYNGHPDAAYEWTMNYHFGGVGFISHFFATMVGVVYFFIIAIISAAGADTIPERTLNILGYVGFIFIPIFIGMYFLWNEKIVVDGANDNLTGCYMGIAILKALKEEGIELENTEVGVIISGSEEAGLRGAKAWAEAHKGEYQDVDTVIISYDTLHELKHLSVNAKDLNGFVKADEGANKLFLQAAEEEGVPCSVGSVPLGATDSAAFNQGGFKATGITALNHNLQDYYHTRKDSFDNLDEECLAECFKVSVHALEIFENEENK